MVAKIKFIVILVLFISDMLAVPGPNEYDSGVWDRTFYYKTAYHPDYVVGIASANLRWKDIQPVSSDQFDWSSVHTILQIASERKQRVFLKIFAGPDSPQWIYDLGVPKVFTVNDDVVTSNRWQFYPFYNDINYLSFYNNFIQNFANYIRTLPQNLVETVAYIQVTTGCTGDEVAYKGIPTDSNYILTGSDWEQFRLASFEEYRKAFQDGAMPKVPLLFNNIDSLSFPVAHNWVSTNLRTGYGVKMVGAGRGHHLSGERIQNELWKPYLINPHEISMFSRSEMDQTWSQSYYQLNMEMGFYWGIISGLHQGLMVFDVTTSALRMAETNNSVQQSLRFFNKYAGQIKPQNSTRAFIALHDGLDASDIIRFPVEKYGVATLWNSERYKAICNDSVYMARGAKMDDLVAVTKGQVYQRAYQNGFNDSGWQITNGNYSRFLTQISPDSTSIGLFRIGGSIHVNTPVYSRFARSFESKSGKNTMYFQFENGLFTDPADQVKISIVYYDSVAGSKWELHYDAGKNQFKKAFDVTGSGSRTWKTVNVTLNDAVMQKNGPNLSDIALVNTDNHDDIFHLIEMERSERSQLTKLSSDYEKNSSDPSVRIIDNTLFLKATESIKRFEIVSLTGEKLLSSEAKQEFPVNNLKHGIYLIVLHYNTHNEVIKIAIQ